ncbi:MAG: queuosine precursor transporter, partial [Alphaproteobacteria bacterium]|nr:queuosine precursor transporter [Alphaproteobacteria bacterium]
MFFDFFWILVTLVVVVLVCYLQKNKQDSFATLTALYCTMTVTAAVGATKMISLFGFYVPGGVIIYAASFLITDLISEIHGKQVAIKTVYSGFIAMLIFAGYSLLMVYWKPAPFYTDQAAFETVIGLSFRVTMASWISFM